MHGTGEVERVVLLFDEDPPCIPFPCTALGFDKRRPYNYREAVCEERVSGLFPETGGGSLEFESLEILAKLGRGNLTEPAPHERLLESPKRKLAREYLLRHNCLPCGSGTPSRQYIYRTVFLKLRKKE